MVALLHLYPSLEQRLRSGNELLVPSLGIPFPPNTVVPATDYIDSFGNRCARFLAPAGHLRLSGSNVIEADSFPDVEYPDAAQMTVEDLPSEALRFLDCRADIVRLTNSELSPTVNLCPPGPDGNARQPSAIGCMKGHVRLQGRTVDQDGHGRLHRADRRVPRLPTPCRDFDALHEYSGALCDRLHRGHSPPIQRPEISAPGIRSVLKAGGRPGRSAQLAAARPNSDGDRAGRSRRRHHDKFRRR